MDRSSKGFAHIILLLVIIIAAIGGVGYLMYQNGQLGLHTEQEIISTPTNIIDYTAPIEEWPTFNEEYFTIKYPPYLTAKESSVQKEIHAVPFSIEGQLDPKVYGENKYIRIIILERRYSGENIDTLLDAWCYDGHNDGMFEEDADPELLEECRQNLVKTKKDYYFGNYRGVGAEIFYKSYDYNNRLSARRTYQVVTKKGDYLFLISMWNPYLPKESLSSPLKGVDLFDLTISTLSFFDLSGNELGWVEFADKDLNLKFKYPKDLIVESAIEPENTVIVISSGNNSSLKNFDIIMSTDGSDLSKQNLVHCNENINQSRSGTLPFSESDDLLTVSHSSHKIDGLDACARESYGNEDISLSVFFEKDGTYYTFVIITKGDVDYKKDIFYRILSTFEFTE